MERCKYKRLSPEAFARVLTVEPAETLNAPLHCSLKELTSENKEAYDALSYVWGVGVGDRPLLCDGMTLFVTPSCESALRYLRFR